jgi:hypothetical protein
MGGELSDDHLADTTCACGSQLSSVVTDKLLTKGQGEAADRDKPLIAEVIEPRNSLWLECAVSLKTEPNDTLTWIRIRQRRDVEVFENSCATERLICYAETSAGNDVVL